jgi:predicted acyl esterase
MKARRVVLFIALLSVVLAVGSFAPAPVGLRPAAAATSIRFVDITASDNVVLKANVVEPSATGPRPAIVFINSWGLNDAEYLAQAHTLAAKGYLVLSFTTRGFWGSGGTIDVAGPKDIADVSSVIDWLLANTDADPDRIGVSGVSYGAGISLIASGHDPRIKAVAAMSAWTDLVESMYGNATRRGQAVGLLKGAADLTGRPSPELRLALDRYFDNRDVAEVMAWARPRGAASHLAGINQNQPAIMIANAYGDSLFGPNQLVDFYGRLTGPKRLELAPGDHAVVEGTGLIGLPNAVWTNVHRWFDHYLTGANTGIDGEQPIQLDPRGAASPEGYAAWSGVGARTQRYGLGAMRWYDGTGSLAAGAGTGWDRKIYSAVDTVAGGGIAILTNGWEALTGIPPTAWLPAVNRLNAGVWVSDPLPATGHVRGIASMRLTYTPTADDGMIVAYLYDVDSLGTGRLITHAPYTGGEAGIEGTVDLRFPATAYDVPAGHRLAVIIDTEDLLYLDTNRFGNSVTFGSPAANPSWLQVPLR